MGSSPTSRFRHSWDVLRWLHVKEPSYAVVARLVEQPPFKRNGAGSIPVSSTRLRSSIGKSSPLLTDRLVVRSHPMALRRSSDGREQHSYKVTITGSSPVGGIRP